MVDLPNDQDIVEMLVHTSGERLLLASSDGRGFIVAEDEVLAQKKGGKQVLNPGKGAEAAVCRRLTPEDDHLAVVGDNRKLLVFPLAEVPEMARGRGVMLQRYKDGGLADVRGLVLEEGLSWLAAGGRTRPEADLSAWRGARATAGRMAPHGFPANNRFEG